MQVEVNINKDLTAAGTEAVARLLRIRYVLKMNWAGSKRANVSRKLVFE